MNDESLISTHLVGLGNTATLVAEQLSATIITIAECAYECLKRGDKLLYCGNGGSAADAQHIATEYVVRFRDQRAPLAAIALTTDTSLLTAAANDMSFDQVFARQIEALGRPGDVLFLHSTSGESENLLQAATTARGRSITSIALLARGGGRLAQKVDIALIVPTDNGAHAQELHLAISHIICQLVELRFLSGAHRG